MTTTDDTIAGLTVGDITDYLRRRMHGSYPMHAKEAASAAQDTKVAADAAIAEAKKARQAADALRSAKKASHMTDPFMDSVREFHRAVYGGGRGSHLSPGSDGASRQASEELARLAQDTPNFRTGRVGVTFALVFSGGTLAFDVCSITGGHVLMRADFRTSDDSSDFLQAVREGTGSARELLDGLAVSIGGVCRVTDGASDVLDGVGVGAHGVGERSDAGSEFVHLVFEGGKFPVDVLVFHESSPCAGGGDAATSPAAEASVGEATVEPAGSSPACCCSCGAACSTGAGVTPVERARRRIRAEADRAWGWCDNPRAEGLERALAILTEEVL